MSGSLLASRSASAAPSGPAWPFVAAAAAGTAVYWVSATGDILALAFALAALLAARRADARRWWAVPLFALSLLSKESTLLLPIGVALEGALAREPARGAAGARPAARR